MKKIEYNKYNSFFLNKEMQGQQKIIHDSPNSEKKLEISQIKTNRVLNEKSLFQINNYKSILKPETMKLIEERQRKKSSMETKSGETKSDRFESSIQR